MSTEGQTRFAGRKAILWIGGALLFALLVGFGLTALLVNIFQHKQEARNPFYRVVEITDDTGDPAVWGKNFPQQYDGYLRTVDQQRTRFGGSEAEPRTPTMVDPRSVLSQSKLEADARLKAMWAGYAFSRDYREERGHAYMLTDQNYTERQAATKQPGACMNCHASTYTTMKQLGDGDIQKGFDVLNKMPYFDVRELVEHPVACIDCHDPETMALRITRPAFLRGIVKAQAAEGVADYDIATVTRQEMRTYVCAQCHVEYYFKGDDKELTYPWDNGLRADQILAYYDEVGHKDWVHQTSGAPVIKAQHPEFEMWSQGIHAQNGVACADCHMPYTRVGALKISDHHIQSPLLNINNACQTCHQVPEAELKARVERIQERNFELRNHAMDALMDLIDGLAAAKAAGASDEELQAARDAQRHGQFLLDFVESENSTGFHADQEAARDLGLSLDYSRKGWMALPPSGQQLAPVTPVAPATTPEATPQPTAQPTAQP